MKEIGGKAMREFCPGEKKKKTGVSRGPRPDFLILNKGL